MHLKSQALREADCDSISVGLPVLAAILSFILYASTNHALVASQLFLAITAFQLTRCVSGGRD